MKTPANKAESMGEVKEEMGTSVAEVQADPDGPTSRPLYAGKPWDLYGPLADLTASLEALIDESGGVYGLHKNGDLAPWDELTEGGRFEDWLSALAAARRALDAETAYRGTPPSALWIGSVTTPAKAAAVALAASTAPVTPAAANPPILAPSACANAGPRVRNPGVA